MTNLGENMCEVALPRVIARHRVWLLYAVNEGGENCVHYCQRSNTKDVQLIQATQQSLKVSNFILCVIQGIRNTEQNGKITSY